MTERHDEHSIPNFFLVGAPKCGTTSMATYLGSHPSVFMSEPKEPNYFCFDLEETRAVTTLSEYLELFPRKNPPPIVGEASTWYLYSREAAGNIYNHNPDARLLAMIRNPIEMAHSLHSQLLYNQIEWLEDFREAWRQQERRTHRPFLQYKKVASLGSQLENLLSIFPREQVKIVVFDDFTCKTADCYQTVLDFLNIHFDRQSEFPVLNRSKELRSKTLARFVRDTPSILVRGVDLAKKLIPVGRLGLLDKLQDLNTRQKSRPPLEESFRQELAEVFKPEVRKLEAILGRDLSGWLEVEPVD